jgi:hypothetical protein
MMNNAKGDNLIICVSSAEQLEITSERCKASRLGWKVVLFGEGIYEIE